VKIGSSCNVKRRFKALQKDYSDHPARLKLVRIIEREDYWRVETWIHEKYLADRCLGSWRPGMREWFTFRDEMMSVEPWSENRFDEFQKEHGLGDLSKPLRKHFASILQIF
jgi:Meiotically up-regulated gene 113